MSTYATSRGTQFSWSGFAAGEHPVELFDRGDWMACLHGAVLMASRSQDPRKYLQDDGLLHELVHLACGIPISTHQTMAGLRQELVCLCWVHGRPPNIVPL